MSPARLAAVLMLLGRDAEAAAVLVAGVRR